MEIASVLKDNRVVHVSFDEPMRSHTTWRIGGNADVFVVPESIDELQGALATARSMGLPWMVVGRGSNLLVQDGGIRGVVIKMGDAFAQIEAKDRTVVAGAGRSIISAAHVALRSNLQGLEFATGIPGSVGGAVMMNAGANGGEVKDVLAWAEVLTPLGEVQRLDNSDLNFSYRYSRLKDSPAIVLRACFRLQPGDGAELLERVHQSSLRRAGTQPLSQPSCGSVFRNPPGDYAARLVEAAGLKGLRHGDAQISDKHANFIVNLGQAKASDVLWLMQQAQETVANQFNVHLETEVRIVGEPVSGR